MIRHICHTRYELIFNDKLKLLVFWQLIISLSIELKTNINSNNNYNSIKSVFLSIDEKLFSYSKHV